MTDPPTPEELAAAMKVQNTAYHFQIAALRFSHSDDVELVREYVKRMRAHQKAVEEAHEAFKEEA